MFPAQFVNLLVFDLEDHHVTIRIRTQDVRIAIPIQVCHDDGGNKGVSHRCSGSVLQGVFGFHCVPRTSFVSLDHLLQCKVFYQEDLVDTVSVIVSEGSTYAGSFLPNSRIGIVLSLGTALQKGCITLIVKQFRFAICSPCYASSPKSISKIVGDDVCIPSRLVSFHASITSGTEGHCDIFLISIIVKVIHLRQDRSRFANHLIIIAIAVYQLILDVYKDFIFFFGIYIRFVGDAGRIVCKDLHPDRPFRDAWGQSPKDQAILNGAVAIGDLIQGVPDLQSGRNHFIESRRHIVAFILLFIAEVSLQSLFLHDRCGHIVAEVDVMIILFALLVFILDSHQIGLFFKEAGDVKVSQDIVIHGTGFVVWLVGMSLHVQPVDDGGGDVFGGIHHAIAKEVVRLDAADNVKTATHSLHFHR